jgi:hypothetical protein
MLKTAAAAAAAVAHKGDQPNTACSGSIASAVLPKRQQWAAGQQWRLQQSQPALLAHGHSNLPSLAIALVLGNARMVDSPVCSTLPIMSLSVPFLEICQMHNSSAQTQNDKITK